MTGATIVIIGEPVGKARPRFSRRSGTVYTPKKTMEYEEKIRQVYLEAGKPVEIVRRKSMETITRKSMLRKTGVEYGDYAANYVQGCVHGCRYPCYAYMNAKRFGLVKGYNDWTKPKIVENTMELLDAEIPKLKKKIKTVQLCFTTDPFPYKDIEVRSLTKQVIKRLNKAGIKCRILTKGIIPMAMAGYPDNEYGITLVTLDEKFREKWEPGAAPLTDRLNRLKWLHDNGLKTWVSMEPYPTPNILAQDISKLLESVSFVDRIVFGRMNYNPKVTECVDYAGFYKDAAEKAKDFCRQHGIECLIKEGTVPFHVR